jgi:hypothetical protein
MLYPRCEVIGKATSNNGYMSAILDVVKDGISSHEDSNRRSVVTIELLCGGSIIGDIHLRHGIWNCDCVFIWSRLDRGTYPIEDGIKEAALSTGWS